MEPNNMAALSERTAVQVVYDDRYLYIAVRCYDRKPALVKGPLSRRDESRGTGDTFGGAGPQIFMVKLNYWLSR